MPCLWCKNHCGDRDFCNEDCYDAYDKAQEEVERQLARSQCDALLGEHDKPFNEGFGTKGNS